LCLYSAKNYTASPYPTPGAFMIGDSLNMRHAVTGGGMTVGLSDVVLLRDLLRPILKHEVGSGIIFPILKAKGIRATFFQATTPAYYRTPPVQSTDD